MQTLLRRPRLLVALLCLLLGGALWLRAESSPQEPSPVEALRQAAPTAPAAPVDPGMAPATNAASSPQPATQPAALAPVGGAPVSVFVIPIEEAIDKPNEYIVRRALKQAIEQKIQVLVLEINTPGGRGDVMMEIMESLDRFPGHTIAFVNDEAMSAGAFISFAADEIWYAPKAVIGSAGVVSGGGGQEIPETMKQKINSYILAKTRALADGEHPHRAQVMRAMMDSDFELTLDGKVMKPKGELLALTAEEALAPVGNPPTPLFGDGKAEDVSSLLNQRYGQDGWQKRVFEITWSERAAKFMAGISPVLMGIGVLLLMIEFKTPGFGLIGFTGLALLLTVFLGNYVAGLAGYEAILFFVLGLLLIIIELIFFPGHFFLLIPGVLLALGSLVWSMADLWPKPDGGVEIQPGAFLEPLSNLAIGLGIAGLGLAVVWRFLPDSPLLRRMALAGGVPAPEPAVAHGGGTGALPAIGDAGVVVHELRPLGVVEIEGRRFEATCTPGPIRVGAAVRVIGYRQFTLLVQTSDSAS